MYNEYTLVAYGCGKCFFPYMERLDRILKIDYFCDRNNLLWGKRIYGDDRRCLMPDELKKLINPFVILTLDDPYALSESQKYLKEAGIPYKHTKEILELCGWNKGEDVFSVCWPELIQKDRIHRFLDINLVGTTSCNFHCEYCYVWRRLGFHGENRLSNHSVSELCEGLSAKRTGGVCFINMCARGETLLADEIVEFTRGLLQEGHYVSIVTNATITKRIEEILCFPQELLRRLFFKISFHYKELKKLSLFAVFWNNVEMIKKSECSFTLEVTPGDGTEQYIDEIKEMCREKMEGTLPHISFTRDSTKKGYDLLSDHSVDEYKTIWGQFHSPMFDLKSRWYGENMKTYTCYAGAWSYLVNAMTGDIKACYQREPIGNIFDQEMEIFPVETVGRECGISYCFNNHAFLAWGCVPEIECASYLDMRDRISCNGRHWVKEPVYSFMGQKLSENNFSFMNKWPDYEKLYKKARGKAFILFNSPDYPNLGDHAIALAERRFFGKYFPDYDFIEISCSQYIKENLRICSAIKDDDILVITGGGNMGDNYLRLQDISSHVIQNYQNNAIIVAPQSVYFGGGAFSDMEMARMKFLYEKHGRLMLTAREEKTYELCQSLFDEVFIKLMVPDMVFFLGCDHNAASKRRGALVCLRTDIESRQMVKQSEVEHILSDLDFTVTKYTTISSSEILLYNREEKVSEALDTVASAEVIVTDRLHCMIFCILTNTPCVVFDNITGKLTETLKWLPMCGNIVQCQRINEIEEAVKKVTAAKSDNQEILSSLYQKFDVFAERISEFIK